MAAVRKGQIDEERLKRIMEGLSEIKSDSPGLTLQEPDAADIEAYEACVQLGESKPQEASASAVSGGRGLGRIFVEWCQSLTSVFMRESSAIVDNNVTSGIVTIETRTETTTTYREVGSVAAKCHPPSGPWGEGVHPARIVGTSSEQEAIAKGRDLRL